MTLSNETSYVAASSRLTTHGLVPVCSCGQDLDTVRGRHCTRCGVVLRTRRLVAVA
jgi:hypothetical protein